MEKNYRPLILVTNDDSIHSGGIKALTEVACNFGDVVVISTNESQSGMSHAITVKVPLRIQKHSETKGLIQYICNGTPVDCVKLGFNQILERKPDLVLSGINHGANSSVSVIYSGTMGAAIEGCFYDIDSIGFSLADFDKNADFTAAKAIVHSIIKNVLENKLKKGTCLNVNIPSCPINEIKGIKICRQTKGFWIEEFDKRTDPNKGTYYWLTGNYHNTEPENDETDEWALAQKYVAITPVDIDMTAYSEIERLKNWRYEI